MADIHSSVGRAGRRSLSPFPNKELISAKMQLALKHQQQIRENSTLFGLRWAYGRDGHLRLQR